MADARKALARTMAVERQHKPRVAEREDKAEPAAKERERSTRDSGVGPKAAQTPKDDKNAKRADATVEGRRQAFAQSARR